VKAGLGERWHLVTPGMGQFRPAVAEQHKRALALLEQEKLDAVDGNHTRGGHRVFASIWKCSGGT
jgi:hypothetical protein